MSKIKMFFKNRSFSLYIILFSLLGVFPILPFKLKGLVVAVFILTSLLNIKNKQKPLNYLYLINALLYLFYLLSLVYTNDFKTGFSRLETTLSLLLFPIGFILFSGNPKSIAKLLSLEVFFKYIFIASSFLLSLLIFFTSFLHGNYLDKKINLNALIIDLNNGFFWIEDHPIYLSIYITLSILMIFSLYNKNKKGYGRFLLIIIGFFELFVLLILSRKGVIISFILSAFIYFIMNVNKKRRVILPLILSIILVSFFVYKFTPDTIKRFKEITDAKSYKKIESYSSTSIRYYIYKCSYKKISDSYFLGYGIGDAKNNLNKCYREVSEILAKKNYNTHNQFLGISLSIGVFGLLFFIIPLIISLKILYNKKDYFAFSVILMFSFFMLTENILDRQNGVILFSFFINYYIFKNTNQALSDKNVLL